MPRITRLELAHRQQHEEIRRVEIRVPRGFAADLGARAQIALDQRWHLDRVLVAQFFHRQRQLGEDAVFGVGELAFLEAGEQVGCAVAAVAQRDAGAADQVFVAVALQVVMSAALGLPKS